MRYLILLLALAMVMVAAACTDYPVRFNEPVYHVSPVPEFPPDFVPPNDAF